ncbi:MAG: hypothetical protein WCG53_02295 [Actinomycetes bacterium]
MKTAHDFNKSPNTFMAKKINYNLANIRSFLNEGFEVAELRRIIYDIRALRPLLGTLSEQISKTEIVDNLIEFAERKILLETLLEAAKINNYARYEEHQPYCLAHEKEKVAKEADRLTSVEIFGSDVFGLASKKTKAYLDSIGIDAVAIDGCISMYHRTGGLAEGLVQCEFLENSISLPNDLRDIVNGLKTHEKNGAKCRLVNYRPPLSDAQDYLQLTFCPTDYYSFLAINTKLDEKLLLNGMTVREKYWHSSFDLPTSPFPNMFYVHLLLVSSDNKAIIVRRSNHVEEYRGTWSATLEEQFRPKEAGDDYDRDVFDTATRGVKEEIGIEVERKDVTFFSLTFEFPNFNLGLAGVVKVKASAEDIWRTWHLGYTDREISRFAAVPFEAETIMPLIRSRIFEPQSGQFENVESAPWHPTARFRLMFGLLQRYGVSSVNSSK